jgi:hypothetical protein
MPFPYIKWLLTLIEKIFNKTGIMFAIPDVRRTINVSNMKRYIIFLGVMALSSSTLLGQMKASFPNMEVSNLKNEKIYIPQDTKGKFTLLGLAYSKKSEDELITWFNPVYQTFIQKSSKPSLFDADYDVNTYFIAMFSGVNAAALGSVKKKMRSKSDPELEPHLLFYKGEIKSFKQNLRLDRKDTPYFFVLDESGAIVYSTSGAFSQDKMDAIEELLDDW